MCMQDLVKSNCCFFIQITAYQSYRVCDFWVHPGRNYNWCPSHFRKVGHSREQSRKQEASWAEDVRESGKGAGESKAEKESQLCVVEIPPAGKGGSAKKRLHNRWRTPARFFLPKNRSLGGYPLAPISIGWKLTQEFTAPSILLDFQGGSDDRASACNVGNRGSIPGSGRSAGEGKGYPLQCSCQENPMDGGAWWATVRGVAKSQTQLGDFTFTFFPSLSCTYRLCFSIYSLRELCGSWKSSEAKTKKDKQRAFGWDNGSWVSQAPRVMTERKMSWVCQCFQFISFWKKGISRVRVN